MGTIIAIIGGLLAFGGGIAFIVFWIMTLVKAFKNGDTVWGVLSIFIQILALIYAFMKGEKGLGIKMIVSAVLSIIGSIMLFGGAFGAAASSGAFDEMKKELESMEIQEEPVEQP